MSDAPQPVVGRDDEISTVLRLVSEGPGSGILVRGPSGIGKSALCAALTERLRDRGHTTVLATARREARTMPLGLFADLVPNTGSNPLRMLRSASRHIRELGDRVVILIDDAPLVDGVSAVLLGELLDEGCVTVVATVDDDATPSSAFRHLEAHVAMRSIVLGPMEADPMEVLIRRRLGGAAVASTVHELVEAAAGNPLLVSQLIDHNLDVGVLRDRDGLWQLRGEIRLTGDLVETVTSNLASMAPVEVSALEVVAATQPVVRDHLDFDTTVLARLERRGLLEVTVDGTDTVLRIAHPRLEQVIRQLGDPTRRTNERTRVAALIQGSGRRRTGDARRIATWMLDGGATPSLDVLLTAVDEAPESIFDAQRFAAAAWELEPSHLTGHTLAIQSFGVGEHERTVELLDCMVDFERSEIEHAAATVLRALAEFWLGGSLSAAQDALHTAVREISEPAVVDELLAAIAMVEVMSGRVCEGVQRARELLTSDNQVASSRAALAIAYGGPLVGATDAVDICDAWFPVVDAMHNDQRLIERPVWESARALALVTSGRLPEGARAAEDGYLRSSRVAYASGTALFAHCRGLCAIEQGAADDAVTFFAEAELIFRLGSQGGLANHAASGLAIAAAMVGDVTRATAALERVATYDHPAEFSELWIGRATGWTWIARGDDERGHGQFRANFESSMRTGQWTLAALAISDLTRTGGVDVATELAEALDDEHLSPLARCRVAHARASARGSGPDLAAVAERFGELGAWALAAESAECAARRFDDDGDARRSASMRLHVATWASRCSDLLTMRSERSDTRPELTEQEARIAALASEGLTSRQIAEQVFLSARTVDNHLSRVYRKLGIRGRRQLADALGLLEAARTAS